MLDIQNGLPSGIWKHASDSEEGSCDEDGNEPEEKPLEVNDSIFMKKAFVYHMFATADATEADEPELKRKRGPPKKKSARAMVMKTIKKNNRPQIRNCIGVHACSWISHTRKR